MGLGILEDADGATAQQHQHQECGPSHAQLQFGSFRRRPDMHLLCPVEACVFVDDDSAPMLGLIGDILYKLTLS